MNLISLKGAKFSCFVLIGLGLIGCRTSRPNEIIDSTNSRLSKNVALSINQSIHHLDSLVSHYDIDQRHSFPFDSVYTKQALLTLRSNNLDTLKYFTTLLMLKRYRYHLDCCNQGYELRNMDGNSAVGIDTIADPILYEFLRFSKSYDRIGKPIDSLLTNRFEFMNSGIIMDFIDAEPQFLDYDSISNNFESIKSLQIREPF